INEFMYKYMYDLQALVCDDFNITSDTHMGVHPPEAMMHFPPVSDFPTLFPKKISDSVESFLQFYLFPKIFLDFHPPKFLTTFFSHRLQILNFPPIFAVSIHFPLIRCPTFP